MCYPLTFEECLWAAQQPLLVKAFDELNLSKVAHEKLFFFDIGLLGQLLGLSYNEHREQGFRYEGYIAENFVQNELVASARTRSREAGDCPEHSRTGKPSIICRTA